MRLPRSYGILLHPTSFPGRYPIGNLGRRARDFLDWLNKAGASWWQVLPLGPTGYGDSPYQSFSAFAGNPYLIDPDYLLAQGWLTEVESAAGERVDYGQVYRWAWPLLRKAYRVFRGDATERERAALADFKKREEGWLADYALFMALKEEHGGAPWWSWPQGLRRREESALSLARGRLADSVGFHSWTQWLFFTQWRSLLAYAHARGIAVIGDMPIFVAHDSADVWANPRLFKLDKDLRPQVVAGVPPDYFSPTGQLWGNPLYDWQAMRQEGFAWWLQRIRHALQLADLIRIDHFRGFEAYWAIPAGAETAENGRWEKAPGEELFSRVAKELGDVPIIAEDLGVITPQVEALRDRFGLPGMKVLQFAFSGADNPFLPENYPADGNCVVYSGTHDNDTTLSWCQTAPASELDFMRRYLAAHKIAFSSCADAPWALLELAMSSRCRLALFPLQDVLGLGTEARMNYPSRPQGNWSWRYQDGQLSLDLAEKLLELAAKERRLRRE